MRNQLIIAFCGPDKTGKSHIAKALSKRLNIPYFKASTEHDTFLKHEDRFVQQLRYADPRMVDMLKQCRYNIVLDRCWACEYVYSKKRGRETDEEMIWRIDQEMANLDARVIICKRRSYEGIVDDLDASINEKYLKELDALYMDFHHMTKCKTYILHVDNENLPEQINEIMVWLKLLP
jgi:deoxyadenosine/deoxycytidine kinase